MRITANNFQTSLGAAAPSKNTEKSVVKITIVAMIEYFVLCPPSPLILYPKWKYNSDRRKKVEVS